MLPLYLKAQLGCTLGLWLVWNAPVHWELLNKPWNDECDPNHMGMGQQKAFWGIPYWSSGLHSAIRAECIITSRGFRYWQSMKHKQFQNADWLRKSLNKQSKNNTEWVRCSTAVRGLSVWLSSKGAPLISVLPVFAQQGG